MLPTLKVTQGNLVGSLQLSATHVVDFLDYGNGQAAIHETINVDKDRNAPARLANIDPNGKTLSDTYLLLAG